MNKKNYLIIVGAILMFLIAIIAILLSKNTRTTWIQEITNSQNYELTMTNCNGKEKKLDKSSLTTINNNWDNLSNNGPWTGNSNICYTKVTISYENSGIINTKELLLLDNSSIALIENNTSTYYTNATDVIAYLNTLFTVQAKYKRDN